MLPPGVTNNPPPPPRDTPPPAPLHCGPPTLQPAPNATADGGGAKFRFRWMCVYSKCAESHGESSDGCKTWKHGNPDPPPPPQTSLLGSDPPRGHIFFQKPHICVFGMISATRGCMLGYPGPQPGCPWTVIRACLPPLQSPPLRAGGGGASLGLKSIGNTRRPRPFFFRPYWNCCGFSAAIVWCAPPPPSGGTVMTLGGGGYHSGQGALHTAQHSHGAGTRWRRTCAGTTGAAVCAICDLFAASRPGARSRAGCRWNALPHKTSLVGGGGGRQWALAVSIRHASAKLNAAKCVQQDNATVARPFLKWALAGDLHGHRRLSVLSWMYLIGRFRRYVRVPIYLADF